MREQVRPDRLLIFGAGGFGREVAWLAGSALPGTVIEFVVDSPDYLTGPVDGHPVRLLSEVSTVGAAYVVALGDPGTRRRAAQACERIDLVPVTLAHPGIDLHGRNTVGDGTVLCAGAVLTTGVQLGSHVQLHVNSVVSHDVVVGAFTTVSPAATVAGHVVIGEGVFIGAGATLVNGSAADPLVIGDGAVIGAGACVTAPVEPNAVVAGVPAVRKR